MYTRFNDGIRNCMQWDNQFMLGDGMQILRTDVTSYSNSSNLMSAEPATIGSFAPYWISLWCVYSTINISTVMPGSDRYVLIHSPCTQILVCMYNGTDCRTATRWIPTEDITTGALAARMCHIHMCHLILYRMHGIRSYADGSHTYVLLFVQAVVLHTCPEAVVTPLHDTM